MTSAACLLSPRTTTISGQLLICIRELSLKWSSSFCNRLELESHSCPQAWQVSVMQTPKCAIFWCTSSTQRNEEIWSPRSFKHAALWFKPLPSVTLLGTCRQTAQESCWQVPQYSWTSFPFLLPGKLIYLKRANSTAILSSGSVSGFSIVG